MQEEGERMTTCMMRADDRQRGSPCVLAIFAAARAVHAVRDAGKTEESTLRTRLAETRDGKPLQADDDEGPSGGFWNFRPSLNRS